MKKKTGYEELLEQPRPKPDARAQAAKLEEAARNLSTLEELARAEAARKADPGSSRS